MQGDPRCTRRAVLRALLFGGTLAGIAACAPFLAQPPTATVVPPPTALSSPTPIPIPTPTSILRVKVVGNRGLGTAPLETPTPASPPEPTPTVVPYQFQGLAWVRVTPAGRPTDVVVEQEAHDSDWVTFHVPPGQYWVFLPTDHQSTLADGNYPPGNLPDRATPAHASAEVIVPRDGSVDVTLIVTYRSS